MCSGMPIRIRFSFNPRTMIVMLSAMMIDSARVRNAFLAPHRVHHHFYKVPMIVRKVSFAPLLGAPAAENQRHSARNIRNSHVFKPSEPSREQPQSTCRKKSPGDPTLGYSFLTIDPNTAQRLRAAGSPFIDGAGNAYIEEPELFVFIVGNRRKKPLEHPPLTLNTAALKTVFHFLCFEADLNNN